MPVLVTSERRVSATSEAFLCVCLQGFTTVPTTPDVSLVPVLFSGLLRFPCGSSILTKSNLQSALVGESALVSSSYDNIDFVQDRRGDLPRAETGAIRPPPPSILLGAMCSWPPWRSQEKASGAAQEGGRLSQADELQYAQATVYRSTVNVSTTRPTPSRNTPWQGTLPMGTRVAGRLCPLEQGLMRRSWIGLGNARRRGLP